MNLDYLDGSLLVDINTSECFELPKFLVKREGVNSFWQTPAIHYRNLLLSAQKAGVKVRDAARGYKKLSISSKNSISLREHQQQAIECWGRNGRTGIVELPTGSGKTVLGLHAILECQRSALVLVPTIVLLYQWRKELEDFFGISIGVIGNGEFNIADITVSTYDSAAIHKYILGNRFGLLVFDECHHVSAQSYYEAARSNIAPYRLGLSATVLHSDFELEQKNLFEVIGKLVFRVSIKDLSNRILAPYEVETIGVELTNEEDQIYKNSREQYLKFIKKNHIQMNKQGSWQDFLKKSAYLPGGFEAMNAYQKQKQISQMASQKAEVVWKLLKTHCDEQIIIFTDNNDYAYKLGAMFYLAVITHKTKPEARKFYLNSFREGKLKVLVTSKVLNEGIDLPNASIAIVLSGSGSVREHVQRLGRILRTQPGKKAVMYEVYTKNTSEAYTHKKRREHDAYKKTPFI